MIFPWKWNISNGYPAPGVEYHRSRVFSCFCCGGGSTMGYKLAGYNVLGGLEVDPKVAETYQVNHHPKYLFCEDIREFLKRNDLPKKLYHLDILDGSPPCTPFSMAGIREKGWGIIKKYAEGTVYQTLDDLFLVFIQLMNKLQPKISVIENVPGLGIGSAKKKYMPLIGNAIREAGYNFIKVKLDSSKMGVPQKRERLFFICIRKDLDVKTKGLINREPIINLNFNQSPIFVGSVLDNTDKKEQTGTKGADLWKKCKKGDSFSSVEDKGGWYQHIRLTEKQVHPTLVSRGSFSFHPDICRTLNKQEWINISSFPQDYSFIYNNYHHIIGNSVPPVMMANLSHEIYKQILK